MFQNARPVFGDGDKGAGARLKSRLASPFARLADYLRLFQREGVFFYLFLLVALMIAGGVAFVAVEAGARGTSLWRLLLDGNYWAIVTIATCGFGDIVPKTVGGKVLTIAILYLAIAFVALFSANITSALTARKIKEARGLNQVLSHRRHLLVLGWKQRMDELLEGLLEESDICAENVVVVADIDAERAEDLMADPDLNGLRVIRGPHYAEKALKLAAVDWASAVLLLADESKPGSNDFEIDSRTVMAALVLSKYVRNAHVVAELLDDSHEPFLRNSRIVDEIIYPRQYGGQLLRLAMDGIGLVNTFNSLVKGQGNGQVVTCRLPEELIGRTYADVRAEIGKARSGALVIGLVEHTGKHAERKAEALREAQRTPDVKRLVENLRAVKTLVANQPRLNPPDDHLVQPNTLAIVIERKEG
jgi:voltage-gated potassium channel